MYFDLLFLFDSFFSNTGLATVFFVDDLAFAVAVLAVRLHLLHHARRYLLVLYDEPVALTECTGLYSTRFATLSLTCLAQNRTFDFDAARLAIVNVFKRHPSIRTNQFFIHEFRSLKKQSLLQWISNILCALTTLSTAATAATAATTAKQISKRVTTTATTERKERMSTTATTPEAAKYLAKYVFEFF
jgi:hypothetical protein